jgi:DNA modification methylase
MTTTMSEQLYHSSKYCKPFLGDTLAVLKQMPDKSVDMIICSPPYWKQRIHRVWYLMLVVVLFVLLYSLSNLLGYLYVYLGICLDVHF